MNKNEKFNLICDTVDNGIIVLDRDLKVRFWNNWLETRTNIISSDIVNNNLLHFFPKINKKQLDRKINTALNLNSPTFYNTDINKFLLPIELNKITDKVFKYMRQGVTITPYHQEKGLVIVYIYDHTLISEINYKLESKNKQLLKTQQELKNEIDKIELLLDATMDSMFVYENNTCININNNALELFLYEDKNSVLGTSLADLFKNNADISLLSKYNKPFETYLFKKDQTSFPALVKLKNILINEKETKILSVLDLSELKSKEKLLAQQTKMAAMGEMLGNIAHQWRQPLSTISTAASGIKVIKEFDVLTDEALNESLDGIIKGVNYLSQTIEDFRDFLREDKEKTYFNLSKNLYKDLSILEGMIRNSDIEVVHNFDDDIEMINFNNELSQAIINILTNAKDTLTHNTIERYIFIDTYIKHNQAVIEIKDNAGGIDEDIIQKIFEPYFTTKHKSQGTGLGLYMTHQIIELRMGGEISARNETYVYKKKEYSGANFIIKIPL